MPIHPIPPTIIATYVIIAGRKETESKNKNPRAIEHNAE